MLNLNNLVFYRTSLLSEQKRLTKTASLISNKYLVSRKREGKKAEIYIREKGVTSLQPTKEIYVNKKLLPEASLIAQCTMAKLRLNDIDHMTKLLDKMILLLSKPSSHDAYLTAHPWIKSLLPEILSDNEKLLKWKAEKYERNLEHPESLIYPTVVPELFVRSKSESAIVARLEHYGVPYHYDEVKYINGTRISIDFVCINISTGKKWYWDHRGMLDNSAYIEKTLFCERLFLQSGIIQGINLIVTSETSSHPLDIQHVDQLIQFYLL